FVGVQPGRGFAAQVVHAHQRMPGVLARRLGGGAGIPDGGRGMAGAPGVILPFGLHFKEP
ncbi:MAG: hypothetical protein ACK5PF_05285, partial [bacterium]